MFPGPVFRAELLMTSRRPRYYLLRVGYGLMLLAGLGMEFGKWRVDSGQLEQMEIREMAAFSMATFATFAWWQLAAILALTPGLVAGVIAEERKRKTLHYLLASQLTSREIVLGKLGARLLHVFVFLAMGLPVFSLVSLFGGIDPEFVAYITGETISTVLLLASGSILISTFARGPRQAVVVAYAAEFVWVVGSSIVHGNEQYMVWPPWLAWMGPFNRLAYALSPLGVMDWLSTFFSGDRNFMRVAYFQTPWQQKWFLNQIAQNQSDILVQIGLQLGFTLAWVALAMLALRPLYRLETGSRGRPLKWGWLTRWQSREAARSAPCGDDAMLWKERRGWRKGGPAAVVSRFAVMFLAAIIFSFTFEAVRPIWISNGRAADQDSTLAFVNGEVRLLGTLLVGLAMLSAAVSAAHGVTGEREQDTWKSLLSTTLTGREIVRAKVLGGIWSARFPMAAAVAVWLVGLAGGVAHPIGVGLAVAILGFGVWLASALGTYASLRSSTSTRSLVATMATLIGLGFAMGFLLVSHPAVNGKAFTQMTSAILDIGNAPGLAGDVLVTPAEVRAISDGTAGQNPPKAAYYDVNLADNPPSLRGWPAGGVAIGLGLAYHAGLASLLTLLCLRRFDVVADRPRRPIAPPPPVGAHQ